MAEGGKRCGNEVSENFTLLPPDPVEGSPLFMAEFLGRCTEGRGVTAVVLETRREAQDPGKVWENLLNLWRAAVPTCLVKLLWRTYLGC